MKEETINLEDTWKKSLASWSNPAIPHVIAPRSSEEIERLGPVGVALRGELAFMKYPEFQTYLNLENIVRKFSQNPERGVRAIGKHEVGHRFCPHDTVTLLLLDYRVKQALQGQRVPYTIGQASKNIVNLFTDMCINTCVTRSGEEDIAWAYSALSATPEKKASKLWRVYGKSMENVWNKEILPNDASLTDEEKEAAQAIANMFTGAYFSRDAWPAMSARYATIISKFLEEEQKDKEAGMGNASENMPQTLEDATAQELAKRLASIGSNGLPTSTEGLRDFKGILAGFGRGDPVKASIQFYDMLANAYTVFFVSRPFGRPRINPFQPVKWSPSMDAGRLDVNYSVQAGGRILPGVNTYAWNTRKRERVGGMEEVVPNLDLYIDSSMSMPNPTEVISLPVLAGFVVAKKAHRAGATVRCTNFSGDGQYATQDATRDLPSVFEKLVTYHDGGTVFPTAVLSTGQNPRQVVVITDSFIGNKETLATAIHNFRQAHSGNEIAVYAVHATPDREYLENAGAEIIQGTTTDIFEKVIGKASEVYTR